MKVTALNNQHFVKWFGRSQIKDAFGPQVMYHGTGYRKADLRGISVFDPNKSRSSLMFFTDSAHDAAEYADWRSEVDDGEGGLRESSTGGQQIYPVFLKVENLFDFANPDHIALIEGLVSKVDLDMIRSGDVAAYEILEYEPVLLAFYQNHGFDGVRVVNGSGKHFNIGVFSSAQIKSAIGNNGMFDPANPDITR